MCQHGVDNHGVFFLFNVLLFFNRIFYFAISREEWVAVVVQEGVQKVFTAFAEALRRESLRVSEGSAGSGATGAARGVSIFVPFGVLVFFFIAT